MRLLLDGHGLPNQQRGGFVDALVGVAVRSARAEAVEHHVTAESTPALTETGYPLLWAITWRTRSAVWILDHRDLLRTYVSSCSIVDPLPDCASSQLPR